MESPPVAANNHLTLEELCKPDSKTGYKGVIEAKPGKPKPFQARAYDDENKRQRAIPGLYATAEAAARALVEFVNGDCPWPERAGDRRKRGEVQKIVHSSQCCILTHANSIRICVRR